MSQSSDYTLANQSGANFRAELNTILGDVKSTNSGAIAPSNPVEGTLWYDSTNDVLKVHNGTSFTAVDITYSVTDGQFSEINFTSADNTKLDGIETGAVKDYNNLDNKPTIPSNNNQLTNGSGFITNAGVTSVNGQTGSVTVSGFTWGSTVNSMSFFQTQKQSLSGGAGWYWMSTSPGMGIGYEGSQVPSGNPRIWQHENFGYFKQTPSLTCHYDAGTLYWRRFG